MVSCDFASVPHATATWSDRWPYHGDSGSQNLPPITDHAPHIGFRTLGFRKPQKIALRPDLRNDAKSVRLLQTFLARSKMIWLLRGRELPAEPSQIVRGGKIAAATASEYGIAAVLWLVLAGLIIAAWIPCSRPAGLPCRPLGREFLSAPRGARRTCCRTSCTTVNWRPCWPASNPI